MLGVVVGLSMVANAETVGRYASRAVMGWKLYCLVLLAAAAPAMILAVPKSVQRRLYPWIAFVAAALCIVAWHLVPVETLRVDRWELMSNFLHRLFQGEYPYLASSHLNPAPPAPFPWLFLVGLPAWAVGEIGWFPLGSLVLLVLAAPKQARGVLVFALATSLPVWYEIVVRSNIVANAALVGAFLLSRPSRKLSAVVVSGAFAGIVLCTRASFAAPILVWAGSEFLADRRWKDGAIWSTMAVVVAVLPFALLVVIWGWPLFYDWNPLRIQGSIQAPWLPLTALVLSPWVGAAAKSSKEKLVAAFWVSLIPMLSLLIPNVVDGTFFDLNRGYFEVAFWNTALVVGFVAAALYASENEKAIV
jgi:hypothetical protein